MDEEQGWVPASYLEPEDGSVESAVATKYKLGGLQKIQIFNRSLVRSLCPQF